MMNILTCNIYYEEMQKEVRHEMPSMQMHEALPIYAWDHWSCCLLHRCSNRILGWSAWNAQGARLASILSLRGTNVPRSIM